MKIFKLTATVFATVVLSACGGGGGSGVAQTPDGDKINLTVSPQGTVGGHTTGGTLIGENLNNAFYGVWINHEKTEKQVRYQGTETPKSNIPKSGIATYKGDAVWASGFDGTHKKGGTTTLNVDFGNKTVDGKIEFSILNGDDFRRDITLNQGGLNGAKFSGNASVLGNSNGHYEGALFGSNAEEAAGLVQFSNNSDLDVAFGGKKQ